MPRNTTVDPEYAEYEEEEEYFVMEDLFEDLGYNYNSLRGRSTFWGLINFFAFSAAAFQWTVVVVMFLIDHWDLPTENWCFIGGDNSDSSCLYGAWLLSSSLGLMYWMTNVSLWMIHFIKWNFPGRTFMYHFLRFNAMGFPMTAAPVLITEFLLLQYENLSYLAWLPTLSNQIFWMFLGSLARGGYLSYLQAERDVYLYMNELEAEEEALEDANEAIEIEDDE